MRQHVASVFSAIRRLAGVGLCVAGLAGCGQLGYYAQSIHGHFTMLSQAQPIDRLLQDPTLDQRLRDRLELAEKIRAFAVSDLGLPDNGSYRSYADLKRPFVVWDVFAAGPLSLTLKQSCFLVIGCVDYRGYYARDSAETYATGLRHEGWETFVAGVPAYSTLGYFNDPLLNTFLFYPEGELARLIFHELAHQLLYVRGDTAFNESFAVTVETVGVQRWMAVHPDGAKAYAAFDARRRDFRALVTRYRTRLEALYADSTLSDKAKEAEKARLFNEMRIDYAHLKIRWNGYTGFDWWIASGLNNAKIGAFSAYNHWVPAFMALLAQNHGNLPAFFHAVRQLSRLSEAQRHAQLDSLMKNALPSSTVTAGARAGTQARPDETTSFRRPNSS